MYSKSPFINVPNFVPFWKPSTRYLLSKFVDFVDGVIDKNSKRYVRLRIPCGDKKVFETQCSLHNILADQLTARSRNADVVNSYIVQCKCICHSFVQTLSSVFDVYVNTELLSRLLARYLITSWHIVTVTCVSTPRWHNTGRSVGSSSSFFTSWTSITSPWQLHHMQRRRLHRCWWDLLETTDHLMPDVLRSTTTASGERYVMITLTTKKHRSPVLCSGLRHLVCIFATTLAAAQDEYGLTTCAVMAARRL